MRISTGWVRHPCVKKEVNKEAAKTDFNLG